MNAPEKTSEIWDQQEELLDCLWAVAGQDTLIEMFRIYTAEYDYTYFIEVQKTNHTIFTGQRWSPHDVVEKRARIHWESYQHPAQAYAQFYALCAAYSPQYYE